MEDRLVRPGNDHLRRAAIPLLSGLIYFLVAAWTIHFTNSMGGIAPIWPANAVLLATVLLRPRSETAPIILCGMIGNGLAVLATGGGLAGALLYPFANLVEMIVATVGLQAFERQNRRPADAGAVGSLVLWAGCLAPAAGAVPGAIISWHLFGHSPEIAFLRWYGADALGLLIFTPLAIALAGGDFSRAIGAMTWRKRLEFAALLAATGFVTAMVFYRMVYPALFLVVVPLMIVSFRAGWLGTKAALAIVAIIGGTATLTGHGPITRVTADPATQVYFFQIYLAVMLLTQMPISATMTAREGLIAKLRESEQSLRLLASRSPILLLAFDLDGRCERVIGTSEILLDRAPEDLVGKTFADVSEEGQYELRRAHNAALEDISQNHLAEFRMVKVKDLWMEAMFRAHFNEEERCIGTIATIHDITQRKNQELRLSRRAMTDSLTGLLNRSGFRSRLEPALTHAAPGALSIAMIDVDRFKLINDNSGHQVGDIVLREIARRISGQIRSSDAVGRLGGDEFVILLATPNWEMVQEICGRIVTAVNADPIVLPTGNSLHAEISCGVARYRAGMNVDEFIHEADVALYEAKRAGRNRVVAA